MMTGAVPEQQCDALFLAVFIFDKQGQIAFAIAIEIEIAAQDKGIDARVGDAGVISSRAGRCPRFLCRHVPWHR